jgi:hypothetical protein
MSLRIEAGQVWELQQPSRVIEGQNRLPHLTYPSRDAIGLMNAYNRMAISFRNTPQTALAAKAPGLAA